MKTILHIQNRIVQITLIVLLFVISSGLQAQSNSINYKAQIKDDMGNVLENQSVTMIFTIFRGGLNVYEEFHTTTTDVNGIVVLAIGTGTTGDLFSAIDWEFYNHQLNVKVDTGGGIVDLGTTPFNSVPYALAAANVTGLESLNEGSGIGLVKKNRVASSYGSVGQNAVDLSYSSTNSTDHGATGDASFAAGQNSIAAGNVSAAIGFENEATGVSASALGYRSKADGVGTVAVGTYNIGGGNPSNFSSTNPIFEVGNGTSPTGRSNALTILQNGKVGIGKHTGMDSFLEIEGNSTISGAQLGLIENNSGFARLRFQNTNRNGDGFWDIAGIIGTTPEADRLNFFNSDGGNVISITGDAKVGINTSNPDEELDVNGRIKAEDIQLTTGAASGFVLTSNASGYASWQAPTGGGGGGGPDNDWTVTGTSIYPVNNLLNVGIGTTNPTAELEVVGNLKTSQFQLTQTTAEDWVLVSDADGFGEWRPVPNGVWTLSNDGEVYVSPNGNINANVGLGTNNPDHRLDVRGDVSITEGLEVTTSSGSNTVAVLGTSANGQGVRGVSSNDIGVVGTGGFSGGSFTSTNGTGLTASTQSSAVAAVRATGPRLAVFGTATANTGVAYGAYGRSESTGGSGVRGESLGTGVYGSSDVGATGGIGVRGASLASSGGGIGVRGSSNSASGFDFYADGAGTDYGAASSRRWKNDIIEIDNPLEKLSKVRGVYYTWDEAHGGSRDVGMIAEEVGEILPEIVKYEANGVDAIGMDYSKMSPLLVEVAKAQQKQIEQLQKQVLELKKENKKLKSLEERLSALEDSKWKP